jgi:hypothetical protein
MIVIIPNSWDVNIFRDQWMKSVRPAIPRSYTLWRFAITKETEIQTETRTEPGSETGRLPVRRSVLVQRCSTDRLAQIGDVVAGQGVRYFEKREYLLPRDLDPVFGERISRSGLEFTKRADRE